MLGRVEKKLNRIIENEGAAYFILIDPEKDVDLESIMDYADAFLIGGSSGIVNLDEKIKEIKKDTNIPIILFPGNVDGISKEADAILYMSLMNSRNTYWTTLAPTLGAIKILKYKIEPIPTAYICIEPAKNTTVGFVGDINEIPKNKPNIVAMYCLSAKFFGMRWCYLEAGSGAEFPVSNEAIKMSKEIANINIIVGGGIRDEKTAYEKVKAGADVIVTGTLIEKNPDKVEQIYNAIKKAGREKL